MNILKLNMANLQRRQVLPCFSKCGQVQWVLWFICELGHHCFGWMPNQMCLETNAEWKPFIEVFIYKITLVFEKSPILHLKMYILTQLYIVLHPGITHWGLGDVRKFLKIIHSDAIFSSDISHIFREIARRRLPKKSCQHWFRLWLGAVRQQVITWANVDQGLCRHAIWCH